MNNTNDNHDAFIIKQEEVLSKEEFIKLVDSYPSIELNALAISHLLAQA